MEIIFLNEKNLPSVSLNKNWFVFGAGSFAQDATVFVQSHGGEISGYCVDDKFFKENKKINGKNVIPISALREYDESEFALIYAVASPKRFRDFCDESGFKTLYVVWDGLWQYDEKTFQKYREGYEFTEKLLADDFSRKVMQDYLSAKKTGDASEDIANCTDGTYFNDLTRRIPTGGGIYVDCGAFDGDSVRKYFDFVGDDTVKVLAIEPDPGNYESLKNNWRNFENVTCVLCGVWDKDGELYFSDDGYQDSHFDEQGETKISVRNIDGLVGEDKVSFIKMDVEGAELKALQGAEKIIRRDKPILAISAYHLPEDLAVLPKKIREFDPEGDYKFYLRHHGVTVTELVLYAIPKM